MRVETGVISKKMNLEMLYNGCVIRLLSITVSIYNTFAKKMRQQSRAFRVK